MGKRKVTVEVLAAVPGADEIAVQREFRPEVQEKLKRGPEQLGTIGPIVELLLDRGWKLDQIMFGRKEWYVPKRPSEATKREKRQSFEGFPCDITVFDKPGNLGDYKHVLIIFEGKTPDEEKGVTQLETLMSLEPNAKLGVWVNSGDPTAPAVFLYRQPDGLLQKRALVGDLPHAGQKISPKEKALTYNDLDSPTPEGLMRVLENLLDHVVARDNNVTRREEQLDQLCNVLLLKLESDKRAKSDPSRPVMFGPQESARSTADHLREEFRTFVDVYPDVFALEKDRELRLDDDSLLACAQSLGRLSLLDLNASTVALGFQVLRSAALKQKEGQYFTPSPVIRAGVKLLQIKWDDLILDPACGTGGFLVEGMLQMQQSRPNAREVSRWAQTHLFGIDKDAIAIKLTKAIMQIMGDGSAHCVRGDSIRVAKWKTDYQHLCTPHFEDGRYSVVVTNPPFGQNLTVDAQDSRAAGLDIAQKDDGSYQDLEIGLLFLNRAYRWIRKGGRIGIVLPETYFFSTQYKFVWGWLKGKLAPRVVANIPMEAFQGFCRAKTNFYVFEKIG